MVKSRSTTNASLLHGAITIAKGIANTRGAVTICKSDNADAATPACSAVVSNGASNVGWASGWIMFLDANANGQFDAGDTLLKVQPALLRSVTEGSIVPTPNAQNIVINGIGGIGTTGTATTFYIKPPDAYMGTPYDRYVCLSSTRRVSVVKTLPC
ncbi:GspH/FimT family protein [Undibacterium sp. TS12]|nr:GspH/FimT family protein [Undibacterium sp. TS12]